LYDLYMYCKHRKLHNYYKYYNLLHILNCTYRKLQGLILTNLEYLQ
jgi:hypothetical protein